MSRLRLEYHPTFICEICVFNVLRSNEIHQYVNIFIKCIHCSTGFWTIQKIHNTRAYMRCPTKPFKRLRKQVSVQMRIVNSALFNLIDSIISILSTVRESDGGYADWLHTSSDCVSERDAERVRQLLGQPRGASDVRPALLRVPRALQGPQAQGPGYVPTRLEIQGEMFI